MILVDTSVWIDHLRKGNKELLTLRGVTLLLNSAQTEIFHLQVLIDPVF